ncbi:MAG: cell division protein FtsL [Pseudomonadota bacterium]|nr:cell division protein FtsL [Pseudomonadota bacterium]
MRLSTQLTLLAVLVSLALSTAVGRVLSADANRRAYAELRTLERDRDALQTNWRKLLLEEGMLSTPDRVKRIANEQLHLRSPVPADVHWVVQ